MGVHVYSSCFGSFVFDADFILVDKIMFDDIVSANARLENNEWLDEEKQLIEKHKPEFFIGVKDEKLEGVKLTQDPKKLGKIQEHFSEEISQFYEPNLIITKLKLKDAVGDDMLIIQTINLIDELNKIINTMVKRLREWYGLYNPEFSEAVHDHERFVKMIIDKDKKELLKELKLKPEHTMGADLDKDDVKPIIKLAKEIKELYKLKEKELEYLSKMMDKVCPNMKAITGDVIGAKLLAYAGSLKRLSELPSSTVQLLGAEKALFRHLTNKKSLPPKYGILHEHPLISKSKRKDHGKVARVLSDKISIAVKVDYFKGEFVGAELMEKLEKRFGQ